MTAAEPAVNATPGPDLAARVRAELSASDPGRERDGNEVGDDHPADDAALAELLPTLANHPKLPAVVALIVEQADSERPDAVLDRLDSGLVEGVCDAVLTTVSPAIFGDCVWQLLDSPAVLSVFGPQLAARLLAQAAVPDAEATSRETLRAADALEAATQLRRMGHASRFDLFAFLVAVTGPQPMTWARAAARALLACIETWTDGAELMASLERLAGTAPPSSGHTGPSTPDERQESDFAAALARAELVQALRSEERDLALTHLDRVLRLASPVLAADERSDVVVTAAVATILRDLLLHATLTDPRVVLDLQEAIRDHSWLDPDTNHWIGNRVAANHVVWAKLSRQLAQTQARLGELSWYQAGAVIDDIVDLYRTSRSARAYVRQADDDAVRSIVAPMIETGFAGQAALLRHLVDHVDHLQAQVDQDSATEQELEDLPVAVELRDAALARIRSGDMRPKSPAGDGGAASGPRTSPADRIAEAVAYAVAVNRFTTESLVGDGLLEQAHAGLAASPDYSGDPADAADLVTYLLVSFVYSRENLTAGARPYLYKQSVPESELAADLQDYLVGSGRLGAVRTEVRNVGGGRVDVEFAFPGFNLYVELKVDSTATPLSDKAAYLKQSASYQTTDLRIGFLLVLKVLKPKAVAPWFGNAVDVVEVADAAGGTRHVVAISLSGGRTAPSGM